VEGKATTMTTQLGKYVFVGTDPITDQAGVYAVLCVVGGKVVGLMDIGESATVKSRLDAHDRKTCWAKNCRGALQ
jgi:hypothetical protein